MTVDDAVEVHDMTVGPMVPVKHGGAVCVVVGVPEHVLLVAYRLKVGTPAAHV